MCKNSWEHFSKFINGGVLVSETIEWEMLITNRGHPSSTYTNFKSKPEIFIPKWPSQTHTILKETLGVPQQQILYLGQWKQKPVLTNTFNLEVTVAHKRLVNQVSYTFSPAACFYPHASHTTRGPSHKQIWQV